MPSRLLRPDCRQRLSRRSWRRCIFGKGAEKQIGEILKKHGVCGDVEALQDSYRKRLGQRLMASLRDDTGRREVLANGKGSYVVLEGCGDRRQLKQIRRRIQSQMNGLDISARKVSGRLTVLERLANKWRRAG